MPFGNYNWVIKLRGWEYVLEIGWSREAFLRKEHLNWDLVMVRSWPGEDWRCGNVSDKGSKVQGFERSKLALCKEQKVGEA